MQILEDTHLPRPQNGLGSKLRNTRSTKVSAATPALTVGDLIAQLQKVDPNAPVVIAGQYGGFECVLAVSEQPLRLNVNGLDGFGRHDLPAAGEAPDVLALAVLAEVGADH